MKKCYLAGPMRSYANFNFPLFNQTAKILREDGWDVISPAELDRAAKEPWTSPTDPDFGDTSYELSPQICRRLVQRDIDVLMSLRPSNGDAIILLPLWRRSTGAVAEAATARWLKLGKYEFKGVDPVKGVRLEIVKHIGDEI